MSDSRSTQLKRILANLRDLGFTDYEAKVYLALVKDSPATAYEISHNSGVPRPNTYSSLKTLASRGAVMPVSENPARYVPQAPDQLFGSIASQTQELCDTVASDLSRLESAPQGGLLCQSMFYTKCLLKVMFHLLNLPLRF